MGRRGLWRGLIVAELAFLGGGLGLRTGLGTLETPLGRTFAWMVGGALAGWLAALIVCRLCLPPRPSPGRWRTALRAPLVLLLVAAALIGGRWVSTWMTPDRVAVRVVLNTLVDGNTEYEDKWWARHVLVQWGSTSVPVLIEALRDRGAPDEARYSAAKALSKIDPTAELFLLDLVDVLVDERADSLARACAVVLLTWKDSDPVPAIRALSEVLENRDTPARTRILAAEALGKMGPAAEAASPALERVAGDPDSDEPLRATAREALGRVRQGH